MRENKNCISVHHLKFYEFNVDLPASSAHFAVDRSVMVLGQVCGTPVYRTGGLALGGNTAAVTVSLVRRTVRAGQPLPPPNSACLAYIRTKTKLRGQALFSKHHHHQPKYQSNTYN